MYKEDKKKNSRPEIPVWSTAEERSRRKELMEEIMGVGEDQMSKLMSQPVSLGVSSRGHSMKSLTYEGTMDEMTFKQEYECQFDSPKREDETPSSFIDFSKSQADNFFREMSENALTELMDDLEVEREQEPEPYDGNSPKYSGARNIAIGYDAMCANEREIIGYEGEKGCPEPEAPPVGSLAYNTEEGKVLVHDGNDWITANCGQLVTNESLQSNMIITADDVMLRTPHGDNISVGDEIAMLKSQIDELKELVGQNKTRTSIPNENERGPSRFDEAMKGV